MELNEQFTEPLSDSEVTTATRSAEKAWRAKSNPEANRVAQENGYPGAGYNVSNEKLIEWLEITDEEQRQLESIIGRRVKYDRNNLRREKRRKCGEGYTYIQGAQKRRTEAIRLRSEGLSYRSIAEAMNTLIEFCIQHSDSVYEGLVAFARASYSYDNLLGMTHNLLDNIGFLYGIQVYGKAFSDYKAKSFHELFNSNTKKLTTLSKDPALNSELEALYGVAFSYTESNNKYKHKFWPGLVHLLQPEWIIRSIPSIAQNLITHLDLGSVSLPDALNHVKAIRESVLPATLRIVLALGSYD